jgi:hypothetical protein
MKASELKAWVATLDDDQIVGIDDGGLAIEVVGSDAYIELGAMPDEDEE